MTTRISARNPRIEAVRQLRSAKGRRDQGRYAFEGPTLLSEALEAEIPIEEVYVTDAALERLEGASELERRGFSVYRVDDRAMRKISDLETPPGVLAVAPQQLQNASQLLAQPGIVLLLGDVSDPANAGALLRTAEAFAVDRVICGRDGVDPFSPKVVRGSMGAIFRLRLARPSLAEVRDSMSGWQVTGLDAGGSPIGSLEWHERSLLLVGSERRGLGSWASLCTRLAAIPMAGRAESLNAAAAGAIALYEAAKIG